MPVLTKINTNVIADDAVTAAKIPAGAVAADIGTDGITATEIAANAVGSSEIAANAVGSSEIADEAVTPAKIAYLGDGTGKLSGTITGQQLRLGTAFTLTDDLTVNGDLTLSKVRADGTGQSLTQDSSANRTITGTGTLRMGHVTEKTSISGFTGVLDSAVTGSPNLNLENSTGTLGSGVTFEGTLNSSTTFSGDAGQRTAIAWIQFAGASAPTIADSFGFSSLTDVSTGHYKPNFLTARPSNDYAAVVSTQASVSNTGKSVSIANPSTTLFSIESYENDGAIDAYNAYCVVFGD
jgi:hypothetical protein